MSKKALIKEPVPYYIASNHPAIAKLRAAVKEAETALRHARSRGNVSARDIAPYEAALDAARAQLDAAERAKDNERQQQRTGANAAPSVTAEEAARRDRVLAAHDVLKAAVNSLSESQRITLINEERARRGEPKLKVCCTGQYKCSRCKAASA